MCIRDSSYTGNFTEHELIQFITTISETDITENDFKQTFIKLDADDFVRYARDKTKTALVLFHAVWCTKCPALLKTMKHAARRFKVNHFFLLHLLTLFFVFRKKSLWILSKYVLIIQRFYFVISFVQVHCNHDFFFDSIFITVVHTCLNYNKTLSA